MNNAVSLPCYSLACDFKCGSTLNCIDKSYRITWLCVKNFRKKKNIEKNVHYEKSVHLPGMDLSELGFSNFEGWKCNSGNG